MAAEGALQALLCRLFVHGICIADCVARQTRARAAVGVGVECSSGW